MSWVKRHLLLASTVGLVLSVGLVVVLVGYVGVVVSAALASGGGIVSPLIELALPFILGVAMLLTLAVLSGVGLLAAIFQRLSASRSERLYKLVRGLEKEYSPLDSVVAAEFLKPPEPTADERAEEALAALKRQYVDGKLTEEEFERKVDRLVTTDSVDAARADRERRAVLNESDHAGRGR